MPFTKADFSSLSVYVSGYSNMASLQVYKALLVSVILFALAGCGGGGDNGVAPPAGDKDLFSLWNLQEREVNVPIDLTGASFDEAVSITYSLESLGSCSCDLTLSGTQESGVYTINKCSFTSDDSEFGVLCNRLNQTGTYSKDATTLTFNTNEGTLVYR